MARAHVYISLLALVACLTVSACRRPSPGERPLEIVVPTEILSLDPRFSTRGLDIKVTRLVHAGLMGLDPRTLEPQPLVARSYRFLDDATLAIELKSGVRFHSGRPLEPRDVCETLSALADPATQSPHRAVVRSIGACNVDGPAALTLRLAEPRATLLTDLEVPILRADQARLGPRAGGELDGLGPYRIARAADAEVLLEPADTGVLPRPRHAVVVRSVRDENARALRLLAGRADIAPNAISPALLPALDARDDLAVHARLGANVTYLLLHNERSPFDRPEVRRAISHAIDRELLVRTLLAGRGQVASTIFPEGHWAHGAGLTPEPFDPQAARRTLAGLQPVTLYTSTDRARLVIARSIAQMLGDTGLRVRVVSLDLGALLARLDSGDFLMATLQMPELTEPNLLKWFFHPRGVPGEGGEGKNRARYRSPEAGPLLDEASRVRDLGRRRELYRSFARLLARDMPVVPLWHEDQVAVVSRRASGFELSAEGRWLDVSRLP